MRVRLLLSFAALVVATASAGAKPEMAPVGVEYSVPASVKTGDEVTTVITFRALADIDRLDINIAANSGLELLSEQKDATFTAMKKGEGRQVSVTIRLTDDHFGLLALTYRTRQGTTNAAGAKSILYGAPPK
jgi:hypothetical protein